MSTDGHSIAHEGLYYSDPLASYITQACARLAGVLDENIKPYMLHIIPPLLKHITDEIAVTITPVDSLNENEESEDMSDGSVSCTIYRRGVGKCQVRYNRYVILEKETACRVLYQVIPSSS